MEKLNFNTKKAQNFIKAYNNSSKETLDECYKTYSSAKYFGYLNCKRKFIKEEGKKFRIISAGNFQFSVAWTTNKGIRIETRNNSYIIEMPF